MVSVKLLENVVPQISVKLLHSFYWIATLNFLKNYHVSLLSLAAG